MTMMEINEENIAKGLEPMEILAFDTSALSFAALAAGQADAAVGSDARVIQHDQLGEFKLAFGGLNPAPACLAFNNTELAEVVAGVLQDLYEEGWYDETWDKWKMTKIDLWQNWTDKNGNPDNVYGWDGEFKVY